MLTGVRESFSSCLKRFSGLRYPTMRREQAFFDDDDRSCCDSGYWERDGYTEDNKTVLKAFLSACSTLKTLCIPRLDWYCHRGKSMIVRDSQDRITRPSALPNNFLMRGAPKDRNGHFVIGIPHAFARNTMTMTETERTSRTSELRRTRKRDLTLTMTHIKTLEKMLDTVRTTEKMLNRTMTTEQTKTKTKTKTKARATSMIRSKL